MPVVGRWTGREAQALRYALRMTFDEFAEHLGVARRTVAKWMADGPDIVPLLVLQEALDTALDRASDQAKRRFTSLLDGEAVEVSDSGERNREGDDVDRRQALAAGLGALVPHDVLERIVHTGGGPVDMTTVADHEVIAEALGRGQYTAHREALLGLVDRHASILLALLDRPMGGDERRRLDAVATGAHAQAATLAVHARKLTDARRYLALVRDIADDSDDLALQAPALAVSAHPGMPWNFMDGRVGDPRRVDQLLSGALGRAHGVDGHTRAWVHRWAAMIAAAKGDERGFRLHMEAADRALGEAATVEPVGFLARYALGEGRETGATEGIALRLLGRVDDAEAALARALAAIAPDWTSWRAMLHVDTAAVRVLQDAPEETCDSLISALDLADKAGYRVAVSRAHGVRSTFPRPWAGKPCVADLDERLRVA
ncbi:MAG: hypothetical protein ACRDYA_10830 [Egibacteraceae bacterium]